MFGIGGLFGLHSFGLSPGGATLVGLVGGAAGAGIVLVAFRALKSAESTESFSLSDMVGSTGRVSWGSCQPPRQRLISFAWSSHDITATADAEIRRAASSRSSRSPETYSS